MTWGGLLGEVEIFNRRGRHIGTKDPITGVWTKDPITGVWIKDAVRGRRIDV